ncbi:hypothetical protein, partial [Streptomyces rhizosphaericus]
IQFPSAGGEQQKVHLHYRLSDPENAVRGDGHVKATLEEYVANAALEDMSALIRSKLMERLA